jgi:hypothetical protein
MFRWSEITKSNFVMILTRFLDEKGLKVMESIKEMLLYQFLLENSDFWSQRENSDFQGMEPHFYHPFTPILGVQLDGSQYAVISVPQLSL